MQLPRSIVDAYADTLEGLSDAVKSRLAEVLERIDYSRPVADVRNEVIAVMRTYGRMTALAASEVAADFYEQVRSASVGGTYKATAGEYGYSDAETEQFVRASVQHLVDEGEGGARSVIHESVTRIGYQVKRSAGETVIENGRRDRRRVSFARVPRPTKTYANGCRFCQMLAHSGFVYTTRETAGELSHYHDGCQCMVVPGFGDNPKVEGYDPSSYEYDADWWKERAERKRRERRGA